MTDRTFFEQHLAAAETALLNLKQQRDNLDLKIETLDAVIRIERAFIFREEPERDTPRIPGSPQWASKRSRIQNGTEKILAEHGKMHRLQIYDRLKSLGIVSGDKKDLVYFGSILSGAKGLFVTDRNGNWSLATKEPKE
jgi:hypothetical protein